MKNPFFARSPVTVLTLIVAAFFSGCSYLSRKAYDATGEVCTTRAFVEDDVAAFLTRRFGSGSQVRTAVLPFTVPANFAGRRPEDDFGLYLAREVQSQLFKREALPLVEVAFRPDWPGKRAEFYSGNFGALQLAREAGYDMVMVGILEPESGPQRLVLSSKLIETESGITVWYAKTEVNSLRGDVHGLASTFKLSTYRPDFLPIWDMANSAAVCIAKGIAGEED